MWLIFPHFLEIWLQYELLDVQGGDSLDSGVHDDLWEIIRTNVTSNGENFSTLSLYLSFYCFETLSIDATIEHASFSTWAMENEKTENALADDNLCSFLGKEKSYGAPNTLSGT